MKQYVYVLAVAFLILPSAGQSTISSTQRYNGRVTVVDGLFESSALQALTDLVAKYSVWSYQYRDPFESERAYEALPDDNPGNINWLTWLDVQYFEKTGFWRRLSNLLLTSGKTSGYRPFSASVFLLRRLEQSRTARQCGCDNKRAHSIYGNTDGTSSEYSDINILVYLNKIWLKNDYGDLLLYNEHGEVATAIKPAFGRVVIWDCSIPYLLHPPSVAFKQGQYGLIIRATNVNETFQQGVDQFDRLTKFHMSRNLMDFALVDEVPIPNWNLSSHLTRKYTNRAGKVVAVYDGVLSRDELNELRSYLIAFHDTYHYQLHDESREEDSDNVQWVAGFRNEEFVRSRVWTLTQRIAEHASNKSSWFPYDVALNIVRGADYTRIHKDCEDFEDEMTLLIYLNPDYGVNDHGETAFFNEVESDIPVKPGNEEYELFAAVKPVYGRVCIFHGTIPHSARPPSVTFLGGRYTFAVKLSVTPQVAKAKSLQEILEGGYSREPRVLKSKELKDIHEALSYGQQGYRYHSHLPSIAFLSEKLKEQTNILLSERNVKRLHAMEVLQSVLDSI